MGTICTHVVDGATSSPLSGAHVFLVGSGKGESFTQATDAAGVACFEGINTALYRLTVSASDYETLATRVEGISGHTVTIDAALQKRSLKVIASTQAATVRGYTTTKTVSADSRISKVSPDLITALNSIPGVRISQQASGLGATTSINGFDSSLTSYEINGVDVSNAAALALNTDLLSRAEVDSQNDAIGFFFLDPTDGSQLNGFLNRGASGYSLLKTTLQGTTGVLGYAAAHTVRGAESALNGQTYKDQSGETYRHVGALNITGNYATVSLPWGDWNLAVTDSVSSSLKDSLHTYFAGTLPADFGPGDRISAASSNPFVTANGVVSGTAVSASAAAFSLTSNESYPARLIQGVSAPLEATDRIKGHDLALSVSRATSGADATFTYDSKMTTYRFSAGHTVPDVSQTVSQQDAAFIVNRHWPHHLNLRSRARAVESSGQISTSIDATIKRNGENQGFGYLSANLGRRFVDGTSLEGTLSERDASTATFDCTNGTISTQGVGAASSFPHGYGFSLGFSRQYRRWSVAASAYNQRVDGALLTNAAVAATALPSGVPPSFIQALQSAYSTVGSCAGPAPAPSNIFFVENISGISVIYRGAGLHVVTQLGPRATADVEYGLTQATLALSPSELDYPLSPYRTGSQLPNIPREGASVTFDWWPASKMEALANLNYVGGNNQQNLPRYVTVNAGLLLSVGRNASLSIVGTNLTNQYVGYFVTPRYAIPLQTRGGIPLRTLAAPLQSPALYLQLHIQVQHSDPDAGP